MLYGMNLYVSLLLCFVPLIAFFIIFCAAVPGFKMRYGIWAALLGLLSVIPIAFVQFFVLSLPVFTANTLAAVLITALIFNGLIEESIKMLCMLFLPAKKTPFSVFFTMALFCGLSLGCFEAVIYLIAGYHQIGLRLVTAVIIHMLCAGLSGVYVWSFRKKRTRTLPFVYAAALHGIYNFFAGFSGGYRWFAVIAILFAAVECRIWYTKTLSAQNGT